jgi:hypothetical protein
VDPSHRRDVVTDVSRDVTLLTSDRCGTVAGMSARAVDGVEMLRAQMSSIIDYWFGVSVS